MTIDTLFPKANFFSATAEIKKYIKINSIQTVTEIYPSISSLHGVSESLVKSFIKQALEIFIDFGYK
jgi:hypothetical protein